MATSRRAGFTLVELLVVMGIVLVLMTLAVAFVPRTVEQQRVSRAASNLQGWLSLAKQWALRDQAPRGLRVTFDPATNRATTLYYIEQPDDWRPGGNAFITISSTQRTWTSGGVTRTGKDVTLFGAVPDFSGGFPVAQMTSWPVQGGDLLEIGSGSKAVLAKIVNDPSATPSPVVPTATVVTVLNTTPSSIIATNSNNFRVVRGPRVKGGEAPLQLPADTAIDVYPNSAGGGFTSQLPGSNVANSVDILFSPFGGVIGNGVPGNDLHLWVIDTNLNPNANIATYDGQTLIVTVNLRSGFISVHPPAAGGDPYAYTRDGKTTGF